MSPRGPHPARYKTRPYKYYFVKKQKLWGREEFRGEGTGKKTPKSTKTGEEGPGGHAPNQ